METGETLIKENRKKLKNQTKLLIVLNSQISNLHKEINKEKDSIIEKYNKMRNTVKK